MTECKKCGAVFSDNQTPKFCSVCGAPLVEEQPEMIVSAPVVETAAVKPARNKGAMVMAIIGMALGIYGLFGLIFTLLFSFAGFAGGKEAVVFCFMTLFYVVIFGGGNVAAFILANKAQMYGEFSGMQKAAKITGLVGVIGHGAAVGLSVILAMVACAI